MCSDVHVICKIFTGILKASVASMDAMKFLDINPYNAVCWLWYLIAKYFHVEFSWRWTGILLTA